MALTTNARLGRLRHRIDRAFAGQPGWGEPIQVVDPQSVTDPTTGRPALDPDHRVTLDEAGYITPVQAGAPLRATVVGPNGDLVTATHALAHVGDPLLVADRVVVRPDGSRYRILQVRKNLALWQCLLLEL